MALTEIGFFQQIWCNCALASGKKKKHHRGSQSDARCKIDLYEVGYISHLLGFLLKKQHYRLLNALTIMAWNGALV